MAETGLARDGKLIAIADIQIGERHREKMGDIDALVRSIERNGLLQPVVIRTDGTLIAGRRRLEAFKKMGRASIPAYVIDIESIVNGELDENVVRQDFTPSERVSIGRAIWPEIEKARKANQVRKPICAGNLPEQNTGDTRDLVAEAVGTSGKNYEQSAIVEEAWEKEPEKYSKFRDQMNRTGKVRAAYSAVKAEKAKEEQAAAQKQISKAARKKLESVCDIRTCSCAELFASGIKPDAVITDPPYPEEFLPVFSELAEGCKSVGVPLVAVMSGQSYLPEALNRLCEHLTYRWTMAYMTPGGEVQAWDRKINAVWKPVLLFGSASTWVSKDVVTSTANDKRFHGWGQSESGMAGLIDMLTKPGDIICDPFMGGGATAVASITLGRKFIGCDIDESCVETTRNRVTAACK